MVNSLQTIRSKIVQHQLAAGVIITIAITLVMTSMSMYLYVRSGASGLDLSRPGFTSEQGKLQRERTFDFASTGKLSQQDYDNFTKLFQEQRAAIDAAGFFDDQAFRDESLGLDFSTETNLEP